MEITARVLSIYSSTLSSILHCLRAPGSGILFLTLSSLREEPTSPIIGPVTEKAVDPTDDNDDSTTIIIIIVTVAILIVLILLIGIVCKRYYKNKGTYRLDETKVSSAPVEPEREYFI